MLFELVLASDGNRSYISTTLSSVFHWPSRWWVSQMSRASMLIPRQAPVNTVSQSITAKLGHLHGTALPASAGSGCCRAGLPASAILCCSERGYPRRAATIRRRPFVKTVLLKRLRPNVLPVQERIHNSQTELVLSQCFAEPSQNLNVCRSSLLPNYRTGCRDARVHQAGRAVGVSGCQRQRPSRSPGTPSRHWSTQPQFAWRV